MTELDLPLRPLRKLATEWQARYDCLMQDDYLRGKYDRATRLKEKADYITTYCPEVREPHDGGLIVDVGAAMGEFLEICRLHGWDMLGVDAETGKGGMGTPYLDLSWILTSRQGIPVQYIGLRRFLLRSGMHGPVTLYNFQGSWAQCHSEYLDGPPHHEQHCSAKQSWRFDDSLLELWKNELGVMRCNLAPGGHVLIVANRTGDKANQEAFRQHLTDAASRAGLTLVDERDGYVFKWRAA